MKKKRHLNLDERVVIYEMRSSGSGIREIGRAVGRCPSVISRELKRNRFPAKYRARAKYKSGFDKARYADLMAKQRLKNRKRGDRKCHRWNLHGKRVVTLLVNERMSPEQISQTLAKEGRSISASTIYRMCTKDTVSLKKYLPRRGKSKRRAITRARALPPRVSIPKRSIIERPESANKRQELGHLETDTIHSKRGSKGGVLSLIDRKSRVKEFLLLPDLKAETVKRTLVRYLHTLPADLRHTITTDNGSEFEMWHELERIFPTLKVYFCDPYASYQKGSIERANQDFRRFIPKGTDISMYNPEQIKEITRKVNNFPLKIHDWLTPLEYQRTTQKTAAA